MVGKHASVEGGAGFLQALAEGTMEKRTYIIGKLPLHRKEFYKNAFEGIKSMKFETLWEGMKSMPSAVKSRIEFTFKLIPRFSNIDYIAAEILEEELDRRTGSHPDIKAKIKQLRENAQDHEKNKAAIEKVKK